MEWYEVISGVHNQNQNKPLVFATLGKFNLRRLKNYD